MQKKIEADGYRMKMNWRLSRKPDMKSERDIRCRKDRFVISSTTNHNQINQCGRRRMTVED